MVRPHQELRPSQFITTYGPGSILETRSGPVVPKVMDELFTNIGRSPSDFEIADERLRHATLGGARIARVPTNAELSAPADDVIYPTLPFPYWSLCTSHGTEQILYPSDRGCPRCIAAGARYDRLKAGREAIRFVLACPAGHLDDVPWHRLVHGSGSNCQPNHYVWRGGGRALRFVTVECPDCHSDENFGRAYARGWSCSGRLVEIGMRPTQSTCTRDARIHQRGAANLHLAEVVSALTIIDMPARLHNVLNDARVLTIAATLRSLNLLDRDTLMSQLRDQHIPEAAIDLIDDADWDQVLDALGQLGGRGQPRPLKSDEFERLQNAATNGVPPVPPTQPGTPPLFEVRRGAVRTFPGPSGAIEFRITPISRLRMVMVQTGYRRVEPLGRDVVSTMFGWAGVNWYPGVQLFGEGIFIDVPDGQLRPSGPRARVWGDRSTSADDPEDAERAHPVHVWWHSLSHRLLRTLSIDSGYSSAAIRERTYVRIDSSRADGGLLLFTVQPGGDGTLGGLIALVDRFGDVLRSALTDLSDCSNDPLCAEAPRSGAPGAACYSCLLASETSCEHRNLGLDRLLLLDNRP
jgi:MrfA Zn-binding domain